MKMNDIFICDLFVSLGRAITTPLFPLNFMNNEWMKIGGLESLDFTWTDFHQELKHKELSKSFVICHLFIKVD